MLSGIWNCKEQTGVKTVAEGPYETFVMLNPHVGGLGIGALKYVVTLPLGISVYLTGSSVSGAVVLQSE